MDGAIHAPDAPSAGGPLPFLLLIPGPLFAPEELLHAQQHGPAVPPPEALRAYQNGGQLKTVLAPCRCVIPDNPPLTLARVEVCCSGGDGDEPPRFEFLASPGRETVTFAIAQGAIMNAAEEQRAGAGEPLAQPILKALMSGIAQRCSEERERSRRVYETIRFGPEGAKNSTPWAESSDETAFLMVAAYRVANKPELRLPVAVSDFGGGKSAPQAAERISAARTLLTILIARLDGLRRIAELWGGHLERLPVAYYEALNGEVVETAKYLGYAVGRLQETVRLAKERKDRGRKETARPYTPAEVLQAYESLEKRPHYSDKDRYAAVAGKFNERYPNAPYPLTPRSCEHLCAQARKERRAGAQAPTAAGDSPNN